MHDYAKDCVTVMDHLLSWTTYWHSPVGKMTSFATFYTPNHEYCCNSLVTQYCSGQIWSSSLCNTPASAQFSLRSGLKARVRVTAHRHNVAHRHKMTTIIAFTCQICVKPRTMPRFVTTTAPSAQTPPSDCIYG